MIQPIFANLFALESPVTVLIIAGVIVLLFGGQKLSTFGKSLGEGLREFKKATRDEDEPKKEDAPAKEDTVSKAGKE